MKISILGTGRMGKGLMKVVTPHVKGVLWGTRSVDRITQITRELRIDAIPATYEDAVRNSEIIIHSFWFRDVVPWVEKNKEQLRGKILVDISNPFTEDFSDFSTEWGTSAAEEIQNIIPETAVVGAFKNTFWSVFDDPSFNGIKSDVYVTSNHEVAKQRIISLLSPLPFRMIDAGVLSNNRTIERMTLFEREIALRYGHYPRASYSILGGSN